MNEFEKDPQEKRSDIPFAVSGFIYSFLFFLFIFFLGTAISVMH